MNKSPSAACIALAIFLPGLLAAADRTADTLTWDDCVQLAATHNPALVAAREQVAAAEAGVYIARSSMLPQFALGASANHSERDSAITSSDQIGYAAALSVEQSLYSGGRNTASLRAAMATLDGTCAQATATEASITYDIRIAFIELLQAQAETELLREIEKRRQNNKELVELRYEGGREHKGSLALSEATLYDAQTQVRQAERHLDVSGRTLRQTIGLATDGRTVTVIGDLDHVTLPENTTTSDIVDAMRTPAYERAVAARANAAAQVYSARSGYRPDINLTGAAGRSGNEDSFDEDQWSVGVKLSFPFWSGGRRSHELTRATASLREADAALADTLNMQSRSLTELLAAVQDAVAAIEVQKRYVAAGELRAEISRQQYEDGLLTFENWDLIENDLISKRKGLLTTQRSAQFAVASWQKAEGYSAFDNNGTW